MLEEANYQLPRFPSLVLCVYKEPHSHHHQTNKATATTTTTTTTSLLPSQTLSLLTTVSCKTISRVFGFLAILQFSHSDTASPWHFRTRSSSTTPMVRALSSHSLPPSLRSIPRSLSNSPAILAFFDFCHRQLLRSECFRRGSLRNRVLDFFLTVCALCILLTFLFRFVKSV